MKVVFLIINLSHYSIGWYMGDDPKVFGNEIKSASQFSTYEEALEEIMILSQECKGFYQIEKVFIQI